MHSIGHTKNAFKRSASCSSRARTWPPITWTFWQLDVHLDAIIDSSFGGTIWYSTKIHSPVVIQHYQCSVSHNSWNKTAWIPVVVSPPSDLLSLTSDHSSHISSVVGVGIRNDDVDDIGLCCSSTGLQISEDSFSDDVKVFNGSLSPEAKLERQPEPMPLSTLPLHAVDVLAAESAAVKHEVTTDSQSAWSHCSSWSASPSQFCSPGSSDFPLSGCIVNKRKNKLLLSQGHCWQSNGSLYHSSNMSVFLCKSSGM